MLTAAQTHANSANNLVFPAIYCQLRAFLVHQTPITTPTTSPVSVPVQLASIRTCKTVSVSTAPDPVSNAL